jgi:NADP-dependent 3-hydroxy acid dehydrogenase YdfG
MCNLQPDDLARAVMYIVSQPSHVASNEVLIRPTDQP